MDKNAPSSGRRLMIGPLKMNWLSIWEMTVDVPLSWFVSNHSLLRTELYVTEIFNGRYHDIRILYNQNYKESNRKMSV